MKNTTQKKWINLVRRGIQTAIVVALSFEAGYICTGYVHEESALFASMWAMVSGLVVLQDTWKETKVAGFGRVVGAFVGATISGLYLTYYPFSVYGLALCGALSVMLGVISGMADGGRGAGVTVVIVMIVDAVHPENHPMIGAGLRFLESCLGTMSAMLVAWVWIRLTMHWNVLRTKSPQP